MAFDCIDNLDMLLAAFPLLAALLAAAGTNSVLTVDHSIWETNFGPMIVAESEQHWSAIYPQYDGVIVGHAESDLVTGKWIQGQSDKRCSSPVGLADSAQRDWLRAMDIEDQTRHWGQVSFVFSGDEFTGTWNYCGAADTPRPWTGQRLCKKTFTYRQ